jgi:hypothetical protein
MEQKYQKTAEDYVRRHGRKYLQCSTYIEPDNLEFFLEKKASSFPCLRGAFGIFAQVDIPKNCLIGFYTGRLIPLEDWQMVKTKEPMHQNYYFGNIRLVDKNRQQKQYMLSPYGQPDTGMSLLRYINSANFFPEEQEKEGRYPSHCIVPSSAINCEIGFVTMGGFTFAYYKTIRDIPAGQELITHYGGGWSEKLQKYAAQCAGQGDMEVV